MQDDFLKLCDAHDGGYIIMFTHPARLVTADFGDAVNFRNGRKLPHPHRTKRHRTKRLHAGCRVAAKGMANFWHAACVYSFEPSP